MKALMKVNTIFERIIGVMALLAAILLTSVMLIVTLEVTWRFVTGHATFWVTEVCEYALLFITFLGTAWLLEQEGHVKLDVVLIRLKLRTQALLNTITSFIGAIIFLVVTWYSVESTLQHFQLGYFIDTTLQPPKWIMLAIIALGSLMLFFQFLRRTNGYLRGWRALAKEQGLQRNPQV